MTWSDLTPHSTGRREATTFEARTETGKGTITPLSKAVSHLLLVHSAIIGKWGMPMKTASTEMTEAMLHINAISWPENLLTQESVTIGAKWIKSIDSLTKAVQKIADETTDKTLAHTQLDDATVSQLKDVITQSWQLLARFDLELTGLKVSDIDTGTTR